MIFTVVISALLALPMKNTEMQKRKVESTYNHRSKFLQIFNKILTWFLPIQKQGCYFVPPFFCSPCIPGVSNLSKMRTVKFKQLCKTTKAVGFCNSATLYNIPFLTPTKIFWIHKLTYFFFIDVFHGIVVPLNMKVPWDFARSQSGEFQVNAGHSLEPRRCQGEECQRFLAESLRKEQGEKQRKCKMDLRKIQRVCHQGKLASRRRMHVEQFSTNRGKEGGNFEMNLRSGKQEREVRKKQLEKRRMDDLTRFSTPSTSQGVETPSTSQHQQVETPLCLVLTKTSTSGQDPLLFSQSPSSSSLSPPPSPPPPPILHQPRVPPPPPPSASPHLLRSRLSQILPSSPSPAHLPKTFRRTEVSMGRKSNIIYCRTCALKDLKSTSKKRWKLLFCCRKKIW